MIDSKAYETLFETAKKMDGEYKSSQEKNKYMSRSERLQIICACMSGIGKNAIFDKEAVKERIKSCLDIAGEVL